MLIAAAVITRAPPPAAPAQVQNGVAVYATWGTLSTLLNVTIYLQHTVKAPEDDCAKLSLVLLQLKLLAW